MRLTAPQIAGYAHGAGFRGVNLVIAVAVSLAESGGNTNATNHDADGSTDFGLWQINSVHADLLSTGSWSNPAANARMAFAVWKGSGWSAWTTFNSGAYRSHLAEAHRGAAAPSATLTSEESKPPHSYPNVRRADRIAGKPPFGWTPKTMPSDAKYADTMPDAKWRTLVEWTYKYNVAFRDTDRIKLGSTLASKGSDREFVYKMARQYIFMYYNQQPPQIVDQVPTPGILDSIPGVKEIKAIVDFITDAHNWLRVALFILGAALMLFGAYRLSGANVAKVTKAAATVGKVVK